MGRPIRERFDNSLTKFTQTYYGFEASERLPTKGKQLDQQPCQGWWGLPIHIGKKTHKKCCETSTCPVHHLEPEPSISMVEGKMEGPSWPVGGMENYHANCEGSFNGKWGWHLKQEQIAINLMSSGRWPSWIQHECDEGGFLDLMGRTCDEEDHVSTQNIHKRNL